jgi:hypothetical protein
MNPPAAPPWWRLAFVMKSGAVRWFQGPTWSWGGYPEDAWRFPDARAAAQRARRAAASMNPEGLFVVPFQGLAEDAARAGWRPWREVLGG